MAVNFKQHWKWWVAFIIIAVFLFWHGRASAGYSNTVSAAAGPLDLMVTSAANA